MSQKLGAGAFGEVYSCRHKQTGSIRAVKILQKSQDNEEILKEFNILKELSHPNIYKVYEMFEGK